MDKRGQGLSLNTIIIAVIVLTVLVVLIIIFTGGIGKWTHNVGTCEDKGNHECMSACSGDYTPDPLFTCKDTAQKCCVNTNIAPKP